MSHRRNSPTSKQPRRTPLSVRPGNCLRLWRSESPAKLRAIPAVEDNLLAVLAMLFGCPCADALLEIGIERAQALQECGRIKFDDWSVQPHPPRLQRAAEPRRHITIPMGQFLPPRVGDGFYDAAEFAAAGDCLAQFISDGEAAGLYPFRDIPITVYEHIGGVGKIRILDPISAK
jgi:hypothetical protein